MTEITDYAAIAEELFNKNSIEEHDIEKHNGRSRDKGKVFYKELITALSENKQYKIYCNQATEKEKTSIIAKIKGVLLYINAHEPAGEIVAVIGQAGENYKGVINSGNTKKSQVIRRGNFINTPDKWESISFHIVPSTPEYAGEKEISIPVNKGDIIGYICMKEYSSTAKLFRKKYQSIFDYCNRKIDELTPNNEIVAIPNLKTLVNKYVLLHELGIIQYLKDKQGFNNLTQSQKIRLLCMILGLDENGYHTIKGILSSPRPSDRNYPLKPDNINFVWSELIKLGIIRPNPIKGLKKR
jgi:hypothetical protein